MDVIRKVFYDSGVDLPRTPGERTIRNGISPLKRVSSGTMSRVLIAALEVDIGHHFFEEVHRANLSKMQTR
jgi:hypothetical protein